VRGNPVSVDLHDSADSNSVLVALFFHSLVTIKVKQVCLIEEFGPFLAHWSPLRDSSFAPRSPAGGNLL
jgi:hypothetical protein